MALRLAYMAVIGAGLCLPQLAQAEGLAFAAKDPRAIGRAHTSVVSGDSGASLIINPGGMVRRTQGRFVLSTSIVDNEWSYRSSSDDAIASPSIDNQAAAQSFPVMAYHRGNERGTWVLGVSLNRGQHSVAFAEPSFGQPEADVERLFPHRYGGLGSEMRWQQYTIGGAMRIGSFLGLGMSLGLTEIELSESRRIWAGFDGRDRLLDARRDLHLDLRGDGLLNPSLSIGALIAPPSVPFEMALAGELRMGGTLDSGASALLSTGPEPFPSPSLAGPKASLDLPDLAIVRSGLRYLGTKSFVEVMAEIAVFSDRGAPDWELSGMNVIDESSASAELRSLPSLYSTDDYISLRAAGDYELIEGYLWMSAGYSYTGAATDEGLTQPGFGQLGGHALALGLEASQQDFSLTVGYLRRFRRSIDVEESESRAEVVNPFDAGTAPSNLGRYDEARDEFGVALEISWL